MRIAICGPGRSGKDTAADFLVSRFGFRYAGSTSVIISREIARREGISFEAAHEQRHTRRGDWFRVGVELRESDPAHLAREVLKDGDLVVGVRDWIEMRTVRDDGLVDLVLWIDRDVPRDPTLGYGKEFADIVVPNHWGLADLHGRLEKLINMFPRQPSRHPAFGEWMIGGVSVGGMGGDGACVAPTYKTAWGQFSR